MRASRVLPQSRLSLMPPWKRQRSRYSLLTSCGSSAVRTVPCAIPEGN